MMSRTDVGVVFLVLPLFACDDTSGGNAPGTGGVGGDGTTSSQGGAPGAGPGGGDSPTAETSAATTGSGGLNGTGGEGGGGGCKAPPSPEECGALDGYALDCEPIGCTYIHSFSTITLNRDGTCDYLDSSGCFAVDQCISSPYGEQGYHRDGVVISTSADCGLLGWTPCNGAPDEPPECSCTADAGLSCE